MHGSAPPEPQIRLLGGLKIANFHPPIASRLAVRALTWLILRSDGPITANELAELVWGNDDLVPDRTNPARQHMPTVRQWLEHAGPELKIENLRGVGYRADIPRTEVDLFTVEDVCRTAENLREQGEPDHAFRIVADARVLAPPGCHRHPLPYLDQTHPDDSVIERQAQRAIRDCNELYFELAAELGLASQVAAELENVVTTQIRDSEVLWYVAIGTQLAADRLSVAKHLLALARDAITPKAESFPKRLEHLADIIQHGDPSEGPYADSGTTDARPTPIAATTSVRSLATSTAVHIEAKAAVQEIRSRRVPGSALLTIADIADRPGLLVQARVKPTIGEGRHLTAADLLAEKWLVIAGPGQGKSTLAAVLFLAHADGREGADRRMPLLIDLADHRYELENEGFATDQWIRDQIADRYLSTTPDTQPGIGPDDFVIILDSLDEAFAGLDPRRLASLLTRPLFTRARIAMARTHFYEHNLAHTSFALERRLGALEEWSPADLEGYVRAFFRFVHGDEAEEHATAFCDVFLHGSEHLTELIRVPLRLNMALELADPTSGKPNGDLDLLSLHYNFIVNWLAIEAARRGSTQDQHTKLRQLTRIAWEFYDDSYFGLETPTEFTLDQLTEVLAAMDPEASTETIDARAKDLVERSLIKGARGGTLGALSFQHKSFQEFLVASWIFDAIQSSPEATVSVMRRYISPEVSEFLKEYIFRVNRGFSRPKCVTNLVQALRDLRREREKLQIDDAGLANRLSIQQTLYYLGNIRHPRAQEVLLKSLSTENDLWIKRGIAVGLAFSGEGQALDEYVTALRNEREAGHDRLNSVNVGYHLSFFGDQMADPLKPDVDQNGSLVGSTVARLLYQLSTETDRASWPLDLYTLVDLGVNRPVARHSYMSALRENIAMASRICSAFESSGDGRFQDDVAVLRHLLSEVDSRQPSD